MYVLRWHRGGGGQWTMGQFASWRCNKYWWKNLRLFDQFWWFFILWSKTYSIVNMVFVQNMTHCILWQRSRCDSLNHFPVSFAMQTFYKRRKAQWSVYLEANNLLGYASYQKFWYNKIFFWRLPLETSFEIFFACMPSVVF